MERRSTKVEKIQQWKCVKDGEDGVKESKRQYINKWSVKGNLRKLLQGS